MVRAVKNWLWAGTMEPPLEKLETWLDEDDPTSSIEKEISREISKLISRIEAQKETFDRQLLAERSSRNAPRGRETESEELKDLAKSMLPSLDALDRIIEFGQQSGQQDEVFSNWIKAVEGLRTRLRKTLEDLGLIAISSIGAEVNLEIHDVVAVVPAGDYLPNTVVEERQKGYYFRGKLIRDAKVVVAQ